jgi:hypothetical protein
MRDAVSLVAMPLVGIGIALAAGTSAARAQTVETVMTPASGTMVVEQAPLVPPSGVLLPPSPAVAVNAPVQTVETVRTVRTTEPRSAHHVARPRVVNRITTTTTTRTTVRQGVVATAPTYAAAPAYDDFRRGPRLYDMVTTPAPLPAPAAPVMATTTVAAPAPMPTYRYVYQPDRILVIDPYSNIAVQAIPR